MDTKRIEQELGWKPQVDFLQAHQTIQWYFEKQYGGSGCAAGSKFRTSMVISKVCQSFWLFDRQHFRFAVLFMVVPVLLCIMIVNRLRLRLPQPEDPQVLSPSSRVPSQVNAQRNIDFIYDASPLNGYFTHCYFSTTLPMNRIFLTTFQGARVRFPLFKGHGSEERRLKTLLVDIQKSLFLDFSYRMIRKEKITMIQANDPYIQVLMHSLELRHTRSFCPSKSMCDYDHYYKHLVDPCFQF